MSEPTVGTQLRNAGDELATWLGPAIATALVMMAIAMAVGQHFILDVWVRGAAVAVAGAVGFVFQALYRLRVLTEVQE